MITNFVEDVDINTCEFILDKDAICINPLVFFQLTRLDCCSYEEMLLVENKELYSTPLFQLFVAKLEYNFYSGFYYNPFAEYCDHYYPICLKFSRPHFSLELAEMDALDLFRSMYDSMKFEYREVIYKKLSEHYLIEL